MKEKNISIRDIQKKILSVFCEFQKICEAEGFRYFAFGGTCLGAVRHKGFIPWDDDIDVAMPIEDYIKFLDYCKNNLQYPYAIVDPKNVRHYNAIYCKLQDTSTTYIEGFVKNYPDRYTGIFIDIFPVVGLPENERERNAIIKRVDILRKLNLKLRFPITDQSSVRSKIVWLLAAPLRILKPYFWATDQQLNIIKRYPFGLSKRVWFPWRQIHGSKYYRWCCSNQAYFKDFEETIDVPFEDTTIKIPKGYDRYLSMDYGDYMTPPPEEQRVGCHPPYIVDLNKSYLEYVNK